MISAKKLVYDFQRKFDAVVTNSRTDIPLVDVVAYINDAIQIWYRHATEIAETNELIREDLTSFERKLVSLSGENYADGVSRYKHPEKLFKRLNEFAWATKSCCPNVKKRIPIVVNQSDDINKTWLNPYRQADFFYEQLNGDESEGYLYVYHQNNLVVEDVVIDYYVIPPEIHAPSLLDCDDGYYDYNGVRVSQDVDLPIENRFVETKITELAVLLAQGDAGDYNALQARIGKLNLFK